MRKIEYAWIEQILSFANNEEKQAWLDKRNGKLERRMFEPVLIMDAWKRNDRVFIRIRLPYNNNNMLEV